MNTNSRFLSLQCHLTGKKYPIDTPIRFCPISQQPLVANYQMDRPISKEILQGRPADMWRYKEMLPVLEDKYIISLGEGMTPLLEAQNLTRILGISRFQIKDEGNNPTGSFKARGLSMAVSKAAEWGLQEFCVPTAGNAGSALAAYTARLGGKAHIFMPVATPDVFQKDCEIMGAKVHKVDGSIKDAGAAMSRHPLYADWWDVTTLKEPFRLEGKKTMGYEIAEQLNWVLPDVIIYPTGGGTGLIGIWKAFQEMLKLGWIKDITTKMVAVQTKVCNPVVLAYEKGLDYTDTYENPGITIANGLRVPKPFGDRLIMKTIKESKGIAVHVSEQDMVEAMSLCAVKEGLFLAPEGAAVLKAAQNLVKSGFIKSTDHVIMLNTGSPYKYIENLV